MQALSLTDTKDGFAFMRESEWFKIHERPDLEPSQQLDHDLQEQLDDISISDTASSTQEPEDRFRELREEYTGFKQGLRILKAEASNFMQLARQQNISEETWTRLHNQGLVSGSHL